MFNNFVKFLTTFLLIFSLVFSTLFFPPSPKKAEAFLGDSVSGTASLAMQIADAVARALAQAILQSMIEQTVNWANTGFEGNPAYVTDPKQYFTDIADGVAGNFIAGNDLGFLCSPFQAQVRLALQKQYIQPAIFQCSLTEVVGNIDAFYDDFSQGGWDGWFAMTQNSANNPYGAYLDAQVELDSRIASAIGIQSQQLDLNQGFLSWAECEVVNPPMFINVPGEDGNLPSRQTNPAYMPGYAEGECLKRGQIQTPGSVIKSQLEQVLPANLNRFINAQHLEDLISAFVVGALNRYVFNNDGGLFDGAPSGLTIPPVSSTRIDIDGDGIADGIDTDSDSELDICYFGGVNNLTGPPCIGSMEAGETAPGPAPTPEPSPGDEPASLLADLQAERSKYGTPMTPAQLGQVLNAVAWKNKDAGWVLLGKASGNNCPSPSGTLISCDFLVHQPTLLGYDVFVASEGAATPTWSGPDTSIASQVANGARTLVAPVQP